MIKPIGYYSIKEHQTSNKGCIFQYKNAKFSEISLRIFAFPGKK